MAKVTAVKSFGKAGSMQTGKRGGRFHLSKTGNKVYEEIKFKPGELNKYKSEYNKSGMKGTHSLKEYVIYKMKKEGTAPLKADPAPKPPAKVLPFKTAPAVPQPSPAAAIPKPPTPAVLSSTAKSQAPAFGKVVTLNAEPKPSNDSGKSSKLVSSTHEHIYGSSALKEAAAAFQKIDAVYHRENDLYNTFADLRGKPTSHAELTEIRERWFGAAKRYVALHEKEEKKIETLLKLALDSNDPREHHSALRTLALNTAIYSSYDAGTLIGAKVQLSKLRDATRIHADTFVNRFNEKAPSPGARKVEGKSFEKWLERSLDKVNLPPSEGMTSSASDYMRKAVDKSPEQLEAARKFSYQHDAMIRSIQKGKTDHAILLQALQHDKYANPVDTILRLDVAKATIPHLDALVKEAPSAIPPTRVFRGLKDLNKETFIKFLEAKEHTFDATSSTSRDPRIAMNFAGGSEDPNKFRVVLSIKHKSAKSIEFVSKYPNESELVLGKGTRFSVTKQHKIADNLLLIEMEEV